MSTKSQTSLSNSRNRTGAMSQQELTLSDSTKECLSGQEKVRYFISAGDDGFQVGGSARIWRAYTFRHPLPSHSHKNMLS